MFNMKMKFEQFTEEIVNKIREFLPERFANASVKLRTVTKNNDSNLTGLEIRCEGNNICPIIYLEQFYNRYQLGEDIDEILSNIADVRISSDVENGFDIVEQIKDFEKVKDMIVPRLIGKEWNTSLLEQRPHKSIADFVVTYHIMLNQDVIDGTASVPITYDMMQEWGVDVDILHELALRNMSVLLPSTFQSMNSVLGIDILPQDDFMFILSNKQRINGATALLDKDIMQKIVEKFGEDFYILPSSVHECIIVSADADMDISQLTMMIQEINAGQVAPKERLSDHPYRYTVKDGLFSI